MLTACQGRFAQRCPSGACEGSLGQSGQFGYRSLTFAAPALLPGGVSGSRVPEEDPGLSSAWLLAVHIEGHSSYVSTRRPLTHSPSSFPLCCRFVWDTPCPAATPRRGLSRAGRTSEYEGGGMGASLVSLLTAAKPRATQLRLMMLCWYEPQGIKSLSLGFAIWWPSDGSVALQSSPRCARTCPDWPRWMSSCSSFPRPLWLLIEWWCFW